MKEKTTNCRRCGRAVDQGDIEQAYVLAEHYGYTRENVRFMMPRCEWCMLRFLRRRWPKHPLPGFGRGILDPYPPIMADTIVVPTVNT